jgi:hypothetical protein
MNIIDLQQRLNKSRQGGPTFQHSIRLNKKMAVKNTVIPINCRNYDTLNLKPLRTSGNWAGKGHFPNATRLS